MSKHHRFVRKYASLVEVALGVIPLVSTDVASDIMGLLELVNQYRDDLDHHKLRNNVNFAVAHLTTLHDYVPEKKRYLIMRMMTQMKQLNLVSQIHNDDD